MVTNMEFLNQKNVDNQGPKKRFQKDLNPLEKRFYNQASIVAYSQPGQFFNVRENLSRPLPDGAIVHIIPDGPCITKRDEVISFELFSRAISKLEGK